MTDDIEVHGTVDDGFEEVFDAFREVLAGDRDAVPVADRPREPLDAQLAAYHRGRLVVDLWSGPHTHVDSLLAAFSASKGVTHVVVALLVQEGVLDLDAPVVRYWPQFGPHGKQDLTMGELLSHQAGLVSTTDGFSPDELVDDELVAQRLSAERPLWRPGSMAGYHALVMGALSGEVVRRVAGASVQELFAERLRDPLRLDLHMGLDPQEDHRFLHAQPLVLTAECHRALAAVATAPDSINGMAFNRHASHPHEVWELPNLSATRAAGTASFGAVGTARALAKLYSALVCDTGDHARMLRPETVNLVAQPRTSGMDIVLNEHKNWAAGFHTYAARHPCLGAGAFGHSGAGGQQSLVDPRNQLSYAFLRRRAAFPTRADPDNDRMLRALRTGADQVR